MAKKMFILFLCVLFVMGAALELSANGGKILYLTNKEWRIYQTEPDTGYYADSLFVQDLLDEGYDVEVLNYADYKKVGPEQVVILNDADLVIIGRGVSSSDFRGADDIAWEKLRKPILMMSNYCTRNSRLKWINSGSVTQLARLDTFYAKVELPNDQVFDGLNIPNDLVIPYAMDDLGIVVAHKDSSLMNGDVLLSLEGVGTAYTVDGDSYVITDTLDMADFGGNILMARWEPGEPMYSGGSKAAAVPGGYRSYVTVGHDEEFWDADSVRRRNFYVLSDLMNQVWLNEVEYLLSLPVPGKEGNILYVTNKEWRIYQSEPDTGYYADSLFVQDLLDDGYNVTVTEYADYKKIGTEQIVALNLADLVIIGRGVSSSDFRGADDIAWEELRKPILMMSNYCTRNSRLKWINSGSVTQLARLDTFYAKVELPDDPVFAGLDIPEDLVIPYAMDDLGIVVAHKDSSLMNGDILLSLEGVGTAYTVDGDSYVITDTLDMADFGGNILMARWEPGEPMYSGGSKAAAVPVGYRTYVTVGHDEEFWDADSVRRRNFYVLSDLMKKVLSREVDRLIELPVPPPVCKKNILYVTNKEWRIYQTEPDTGYYADSLFVQDLLNAGHNVEVTNYADYKKVDPEQISAINMADLVILGRGISSSDFRGADDVAWEELTKPILMMSNYCTRNSRLKWINSGSVTQLARLDTFYAKVELPDDPVFAGLDVPADLVIPYAEDDLGIVVAHKDSGLTNGDVLLSLEGVGTAYTVDGDNYVITDTLDMADYGGNILMARWAPGDSMYSGGSIAAAVPGGYRTYITVGHDEEFWDADSVRRRNFYVLSDLMNIVLRREVERLLALPVPAPAVKKEILYVTNKEWRIYQTEPDTGYYADSLFVQDLENEGYEVIVTDYANYKKLELSQVDTLKNVDLIIIGRGVSSSDFRGLDDEVWAQLGTPIIMMSNYCTRNSRLKWINSGSVTQLARLDTFYAKVELPNDPVFACINVPNDMVIPYAKDDLGIVVAHKDSSLINGDVVLSLEGVGTAYTVDGDNYVITDTLDMADYDGNILMARWAPGDSMYSGGSKAAAVPNGHRTYITVGHDEEFWDADSVRRRNFYVLTDIMKQVWLAEVARMVHLWIPSGEIIPGVDDDNVMPKQYTLHQNYPNPFNPSTNIKFSLKKPGHTTLTVYNVIGREVMKVVDRKLNSGVHVFTFDASRFTSGVYFYRLSSGDFKKVKKMMLVK